MEDSPISELLMTAIMVEFAEVFRRVWNAFQKHFTRSCHVERNFISGRAAFGLDKLKAPIDCTLGMGLSRIPRFAFSTLMLKF